jgi:hypothetical protein
MPGPGVGRSSSNFIMPLRIGFDLDGTLADFASAFHDVEVRLFGPSSHMRPGEPEREEEERGNPAVASGAPGSAPVVTAETDQQKDRRRRKADKEADREATRSRRRRDVVWSSIRSTPDFWAGLKPLDPGAVKRIHELALRHKWEVFFITQRPYTDGETVQRQSQHWLIAQGYDMPSVLVIGGSRGAAAGALRLDYHVDDSAQNCLDIVSESRARTILLVAEDDGQTIVQARRLKIGTATTIAQALDILERASTARTQPKLLDRIASLVGWGSRP